MEKQYHSVELIEDKCIGCTDCIKRCPTEAIRVRDGKAKIISERCIDCGMCIRICRNYAKKASTQPLKIIKEYPFKVALPAPTLYGQFKNVWDVNAILTAIKRLGFDDVFEVARAAEIVTEETKRYIASMRPKKTLISSACPVIIRLIGMRFPSLLDNLLPIKSPMEVAAIAAKDYYEKKGMRRDEIGVFFISPCAAKSTYLMNPLGVKKSDVDGVISIQDIYMPLRNSISTLDKIEPLCQSVQQGMEWATTGGESRNVNIENAIAVDGLDNVIKVLEALENGQISDVDFIEALACMGGCVGGPISVVNGYVAKNFIRRAEQNTRNLPDEKKRHDGISGENINCYFDMEIETTGVIKLDKDMSVALKKMEDISRIFDALPLIDCGSCGAPTCLAMAEDIVQGNALIEDCIFMLRSKVKAYAQMMVDLSEKLPQTLNREKIKQSREQSDR